MLENIVLLILGYLLGSIPNGLIVGKLAKGVDIREHGSGNLGATNAIRVLGKKLGLFVFALDVLKGALPILLARDILPVLLPNVTFWEFTIVFGAASIIGHVFPLFANFRGGKAVATSLGVVLALTPIPALLCLVAFFIYLKITGYVSMASTIAALTVLVSTLIMYLDNTLIVITYSIFVVLILVKHKKNYQRILAGTEHSFKKSKKV